MERRYDVDEVVECESIGLISALQQIRVELLTLLITSCQKQSKPSFYQQIGG